MTYPKLPTIRTEVETWIDPIYDRTESDITNKTTKAYLNVDDINRIEADTYNMSEALNLKLVCKKWEYDNIPTKENIKRIGDNANSLLVKIGRSINTYNSKPNYEDINKIERALKYAYDFVIQQKSIQIQAGCYFANEPLTLVAERK